MTKNEERAIRAAVATESGAWTRTMTESVSCTRCGKTYRIASRAARSKHETRCTMEARAAERQAARAADAIELAYERMGGE